MHTHSRCFCKFSWTLGAVSHRDDLSKDLLFHVNKITITPFKSFERKSENLDLVHSDIYNFYCTPSLGNKRFVITFINDYSKFCYVYLL